MANDLIFSRDVEVEDKDKWNDFIENSPWGDILQFWQWGEVKSNEEWKPKRIAVFKDDNIILAAQCLIKKAPLLGNYIYIPHGPVFQKVEDLILGLESLKNALVDLAKQYKAFAIEIEPKLGIKIDERELPNNLKHFVSKSAIDVFKSQKFQLTDRNMQPKYKLLYDLEMSDDDIMLLMKKNTRYNVRYAKKNGVEVNEYLPKDSKIETKLKEFYQLLIEMQKRAKGYPIRPLSSFKKLFHEFMDSNNLALFETKYNDDLIAINISERTKFWSSSFYAGSNRLHPNLKASYLLRWESIQVAKKYGSKVYDFWGIIPESEQHKGYSDTKLSFGGYRIDHLGIMALPIVSWKYKLWSLAIKLRPKIYSLLRK